MDLSGAQKGWLEVHDRWVVLQSDAIDGAYAKVGRLFQDGRFLESVSGSALAVSSPDENWVTVGLPSEKAWAKDL